MYSLSTEKWLAIIEDIARLVKGLAEDERIWLFFFSLERPPEFQTTRRNHLSFLGNNNRCSSNYSSPKSMIFINPI